MPAPSNELLQQILNFGNKELEILNAYRRQKVKKVEEKNRKKNSKSGNAPKKDYESQIAAIDRILFYVNEVNGRCMANQPDAKKAEEAEKHAVRMMEFIKRNLPRTVSIVKLKMKDVLALEEKLKKEFPDYVKEEKEKKVVVAKPKENQAELVVQEIKSSETTYLDSLNKLSDYVSKLAQVVTDKEQLQDVHQYQKALNEIIKNSLVDKDGNLMVGDSKSSYSLPIKSYVDLISLQQNMSLIFEQALTQDKFSLNEKTAGEASLHIRGLLILPVQRVPRYLLLADAYLKMEAKERNDFNETKSPETKEKEKSSFTMEMEKFKTSVASECRYINTLKMIFESPVVNRLLEIKDPSDDLIYIKKLLTDGRKQEAHLNVLMGQIPEKFDFNDGTQVAKLRNKIEYLDNIYRVTEIKQSLSEIKEMTPDLKFIQDTLKNASKEKGYLSACIEVIPREFDFTDTEKVANLRKQIGVIEDKFSPPPLPPTPPPPSPPLLNSTAIILKTSGTLDDRLQNQAMRFISRRNELMESGQLAGARQKIDYLNSANKLLEALNQANEGMPHTNYKKAFKDYEIAKSNLISIVGNDKDEVSILNRDHASLNHMVNEVSRKLSQPTGKADQGPSNDSDELRKNLDGLVNALNHIKQLQQFDKYKTAITGQVGLLNRCKNSLAEGNLGECKKTFETYMRESAKVTNPLIRNDEDVNNKQLKIQNTLNKLAPKMTQASPSVQPMPEEPAPRRRI